MTRDMYGGQPFILDLANTFLILNVYIYIPDYGRLKLEYRTQSRIKNFFTKLHVVGVLEDELVARKDSREKVSISREG